MKSRLPHITIAALLFIGAFFFYTFSTPAKAKCPDDYGTDDAGSAEYLADTDKWTNDFYDQHPNATLTEWAMARKQFWIDNDCTATLERYEQAKAGNADPKTMEMVNEVLQEAVNGSSTE